MPMQNPSFDFEVQVMNVSLSLRYGHVTVCYWPGPAAIQPEAGATVTGMRVTSPRQLGLPHCQCPGYYLKGTVSS
jgi:hypothetical protein